MAKGSQQGVSSSTVWMIVFAGAWLASTVFLVVLYTGRQELVDENAKLKQQKEKYASPDEDRSIEVVKTAKPASEGGPTVVGLLEQSRSQTAALATGVAGDDVATIRTKRNQLVGDIQTGKLLSDAAAFQDASFLDVSTKLYASYKSLHDKWKKAEESLVSLDDEVGKLRDASTAFKTDCDGRMKGLGDELAKVEADRNTTRKEREDGVAQIEGDFKKQSDQNTSELTKVRQTNQACQQQLAESRDRYGALREKLGGMIGGPGELSTARQPDGKVLTAIPGDPVVYINLGAQSALTLGLQFAVYSSETGIPADGRSKGVVEVVSISENSAECRILQLGRNEVILEGDLIANPVYDPKRPLSFAVFGDFDLDRDGQTDRDGAASIESLIAKWGGQITKEINPLTDFVVLGAAPARPRAASELAPEQAEANKVRQRAWDEYYKTLETAKALSVPIMTQDVFLNFLGRRDSISRR